MKIVRKAAIAIAIGAVGIGFGAAPSSAAPLPDDIRALIACAQNAPAGATTQTWTPIPNNTASCVYKLNNPTPIYGYRTNSTGFQEKFVFGYVPAGIQTKIVPMPVI